MNYIVYQTTNLVNSKVYVGVHKMDINHPDTYIGCGVTHKDKKKKVKIGFPAAVRKYGYSNFRRDILFVYPGTKEGRIDAYLKEEEIVTEEWVKSDKNYNLVPGGLGGAGKMLEKPVNQYDLDGKYIKTWNSITEAKITLGVPCTGIGGCCSGVYKESCGYQWRLDTGDHIDLDTVVSPKEKTVYQFDLKGNLIKVWKSAVEAGKQFDNQSSARTLIAYVCNKKPKYTQALGYYWSYKHIFDYVPAKDCRIPVACYTDDGTFVKSYESGASAEKALNITSGNICQTISGKRKHCKGFRWRYFDGDTSNIEPLT